MAKVIGIIKLLASFIGIVSCIIAFTYTARDNDFLTATLTIAIVSVICALYFYYLIRTALWNLNNTIYIINIFLLIGLVLHFGVTFLFLWYNIQHLKGFLLTSIPCSFVAIAWGVYDANKFYQSWKNKHLKTL